MISAINEMFPSCFGIDRLRACVDRGEVPVGSSRQQRGHHDAVIRPVVRFPADLKYCVGWVCFGLYCWTCVLLVLVGDSASYDLLLV